MVVLDVDLVDGVVVVSLVVFGVDDCFGVSGWGFVLGVCGRTIGMGGISFLISKYHLK